VPILRPLLSFAVLAAVAALSPASAFAGFRPGGPTPGICTNPAFTDVVGTAQADQLVGGARPQRIYGLTGDDRLTGSGQRASCLFGGQGADLLAAGAGGGIALGEDGPDVLLGSFKDDGLSGGPGADTLIASDGKDALRGDTGIDGFFAGQGDDIVAAADGRREVVACGGGDDVVEADRADALFGCERVRLQGRPLPTQHFVRSTGRPRTTFRFAFRAPAAGGAGSYAVLAARCDESDPFAATVVPAPGRRVRKGQLIRVGLRAPTGGWCQGRREAALVRAPRCSLKACLIAPPYEPLARIRFRVVK
jgi:RTX calcium-binding nonapeptide repeat (4 copies)